MYRFSAWGTSTGRSTRAFRTLNTTALAPIPSASVAIAVRAKPGDFINCRIAYRISLNIVVCTWAPHTRVPENQTTDDDKWLCHGAQRIGSGVPAHICAADAAHSQTQDHPISSAPRRIS